MHHMNEAVRYSTLNMMYECTPSSQFYKHHHHHHLVDNNSQRNRAIFNDHIQQSTRVSKQVDLSIGL